MFKNELMSAGSIKWQYSQDGRNVQSNSQEESWQWMRYLEWKILWHCKNKLKTWSLRSVMQAFWWKELWSNNKNIDALVTTIARGWNRPRIHLFCAFPGLMYLPSKKEDTGAAQAEASPDPRATQTQAQVKVQNQALRLAPWVSSCPL